MANIDVLEIIAMSTTKSISSTSVQNSFGKILSDVVQNNTRYIIKRHNIGQAIILSISEFDTLVNNHVEQRKLQKYLRELSSVYDIGEAIKE